ncbi:MAG: T9SS type A sorting domain-containing protein [Bacteroidia bacterium]|nr:T9SS type A sorting domain-containing protein [Bacteroidia bacterium]
MTRLARISCCLFMCLHTAGAFAQYDIPIGAWRMHISYNTIKAIAIDDAVYAAAPNGIMVLDKDDRSLIQTYSKINGLSAQGIRYLAADPASHRLLVVYDDANLDVITDSEVVNFDRLKTAAISGSRAINHVMIYNGLAYLAADYGVVVFDVAKGEVKETWRDLGASGETLATYQTVLNGDSLMVATANGVIAGKLTDNLLDFNNWKRYNTGAFVGVVSGIVRVVDKVYAAVDGGGLYRYDNGTWTLLSFLQGVDFDAINASDEWMLVIENGNLWRSDGNVANEIVGEHIAAPLFAAEESNTIWVGDATQGLVAYQGGITSQYLPNGPHTNAGWKLKYGLGQMYALSGGYNSTMQPLSRPGTLDVCEQGAWRTETSAATDLTDLDFAIGSDKTYFVASMGYGVEQRDNTGSVQFFNDSNSPLVNLSPGYNVRVAAIEAAASGLWVANTGAVAPLHVYQGTAGWKSFNLGSALPRSTVDMRVDFSNNVWMVINPAQGGGMWVVDGDNADEAYLTDQAGAGGLPSKSVRSIAVDRDGLIWVGTDKGVAYFTSDVFGTVNAIRPIFDNRYLLTDEKVTAIKVDAGNRKWIGTEHGVWLFNPTGEEQIYNFTSENSPLLSDVIRDIEIDEKTGEVFFSTDKGIVSFRGTATAGADNFDEAKIFPNPVTRAFSGLVGITGLATDATVKITDVSGRMIWQTYANGGTATWNLLDNAGRRATTGVYLVFAATADGSERFVGKIAVVD